MDEQNMWSLVLTFTVQMLGPVSVYRPCNGSGEDMLELMRETAPVADKWGQVAAKLQSKSTQQPLNIRQ